MRILHVYRTCQPETFGGVEQFIAQLSRGMAARGYDVHVIALGSNSGMNSEERDGYRITRFKRTFEIASTGFSFALLKHFSTLAKEADVIHYHYPWPFMDLLHFLIRPNKPILVTYHSDIVRQRLLLKFYRPLQRWFFQRVDQFVVASANYLKSSPELSAFTDRVEIIPYGLDEKTYPAAADDRLAHWRSRLGERFFLFVGVLRYYKGLHVLLDAVLGTDCRLVIAGAGPMERELKKQAAQLKLNCVEFLGSVNEQDKAALYTLAYGFILPSHLRSEAFGIAMLEAAMYGKPMICCDIDTATTMINVHGTTGLVVPPADSESLREAMLRLWNDAEYASSLGRAARAHFLENFSIDQMCDSYEALYKRLCKHHTSANVRVHE